MIELSALQTDGVSGGFSWGDVLTMSHLLIKGTQEYVIGVGAAGQTLSNYYGNDMTIEIFAAGNMSA